MTATTTDRSTVCNVCSAPMAEGASRCEACGATRGAHHKCPFCGAIAEPQPHPTLRFACPVCGGPRMPAAEDAPLPGPEVIAALRTARSARASSTAWKAAALLGVGFGAFSLLLLTGIALIANPSLLPLLAAALVASAPLIFALVAWSRAGQKRGTMTQALDTAWLHAAHQFAATRTSVRAPQLAQALGVGAQQAQTLMTQLSARDDVSTAITDDGEIALSVRVPPRLRVDAAHDAPGTQQHPNASVDVAEEEVVNGATSPARKAGA